MFKKFGYIGNSIYILDRLLRTSKFDKKTIYLLDFDDLEVNQCADMISQSFHEKNVNEIEVTVLKIAAYLGNLIKQMGYPNPPLTTFRLNNLLANMPYDTKAVELEIGKLPFSLKK